MVGGRAVGDVEIAPEASSSGSTHTRCTRHASDDSDGVWRVKGYSGDGATYSLGYLGWAGATEGKAVYDRACKSCHGADGAGNPTIAKMMKVDIPPLSASAVQSLPDADLKAVITKGKGKMKPITSVTGNQLDDVVAFVRTLKK